MLHFPNVSFSRLNMARHKTELFPPGSQPSLGISSHILVILYFVFLYFCFFCTIDLSVLCDMLQRPGELLLEWTKKAIKFLKILTISNFNINQIYPVQYTVGLGEICLVVLDFKIKTGSLEIGQEIKKKIKAGLFSSTFWFERSFRCP